MSSVLIIDDDPSVLHVFRRVFQDSKLTLLTAESGAEGLELVIKHPPDVVLLDIMLPDGQGMEVFERIQRQDATLPVIFITADTTSETAIEAMKRGAFDYLLKPLDFPRVRELVEKALEIRRLMHVPVTMDPRGTRGSRQTDSLVGRCEPMQAVYKAIGRVAPQNVTVLIRGESGTGKELIARAIYQHSPRASGRFLAVNCAAIPETLLESELFGHEKGSFTGADSRRIGKFEQCSGGTLFLDEIGDMTPLLQSKVLRLLQDQRFERVGGNETIKTDVRIVAATHRDLEKMVEEGTFRADLYYRLNGFTIKLPPLRERSDDILVLVEHFLRIFNRELGKNVCEVSSEAADLLMEYRWPGNIRELQSVIKQALLQATGPVLLPDFLPPELHAGGKSGSGAGKVADDPLAGLDHFIQEKIIAGSDDLYADTINLVERLLITRVLRHCGGNQSKAAKILGITRGSLRNKARTHRISIDQTVNIDEEQEETAESLPVFSVE
jgi:two-component system nitrogen regulation response regulator GlnG